MSSKVPGRGDLVLLNFSPQAGCEQSGYRPGVVLSPKKFNKITGYVTIAPITINARGWGYEVSLPSGLVFEGVILTDQIKNLDWSARNLKIKGHAPPVIVEECLNKIATFLL
ncbi:MAG: type II toxin-antitoxin system PemK/MazF family toxin [Bacteroidetes bacterium]|nr:type II toxin-antitoxin system PemK/MazF family toxin [Bacteroidota bacterium]